jgi:membrane associated rhomboid family serine protease
VRHCADRGEAELYGLVLSARGIENTILAEDRGFSVRVASGEAERATAEIEAYDAENQRRPVDTKAAVRAPPDITLVLIYWAILLFFFAAVRRDAFAVAWLDIGSAQMGSIRAGEWWRTVTALFLHVSGIHLLSNLIFGTLFLLLLTQVLGAGLTALAVVAAGAFGNLLDALVRPSFHVAIGASTAVFAAIGLAAAMRQNWRVGHGFRQLRDWAPLAGGVMLLAFLGFSGEQTDIVAHVFGFAVGVGGGALLAWLDRAWPENQAVQRRAGWAAAAIVALAWLCAMLT